MTALLLRVLEGKENISKSCNMTFLVSLPAPFLTSHTHTHTLATYIGGANSKWFEFIWELQFLLLWLQSPLPHRDRGMERLCELHRLYTVVG